MARKKPNDRQFHSCQKKRAYDTLADAQCIGCKVYTCPICGYYHRTTDKKHLRSLGVNRGRKERKKKKRSHNRKRRRSLWPQADLEFLD